MNVSKLHYYHKYVKTRTNVYDRAFVADYEPDIVFNNYNVILRMHHAIFAFLCLLEISLFTVRTQERATSVNQMMQNIQFPECILHLKVVLASEKKLRP